MLPGMNRKIPKEGRSVSSRGPIGSSPAFAKHSSEAFEVLADQTYFLPTINSAIHLSATKAINLLPDSSMFSPQTDQSPNKAPEPTPPLVTIRADARLAPSGVVAHL